ncbi:STAS domain-containing protein [Sulfitobacter pacificus]|uniref:STAS domain-containing protein n=1 Tax=Sulfitobacter pacificus TaxID=1499314 RepID=UPI003107AC6F
MGEPLMPEGKLDVAAAVSFHSELTARIGQDVIIDCEKVTQIGALCLQTCLAAAREARRNQTRFKMINVSDPVLVQLTSMGFTPETLAEGTT